MDSSATQGNNGLGLKVIILSLIVLTIVLTVVIAFFSAQKRSKDTITKKDMVLLQKFLSAYNTEHGFYPAAANGYPTGYEKYLEALPKNDNASCLSGGRSYKYETINAGNSYKLTYCISSGIYTTSPDNPLTSN